MSGDSSAIGKVDGKSLSRLSELNLNQIRTNQFVLLFVDVSQLAPDEVFANDHSIIIQAVGTAKAGLDFVQINPVLHLCENVAPDRVASEDRADAPVHRVTADPSLQFIRVESSYDQGEHESPDLYPLMIVDASPRFSGFKCKTLFQEQEVFLLRSV